MNLTTVRRRATTAGAAVAATALVSLALPIGPAAAAEGDDVDVVNTETVQVYTDASGEVKSKRIYEQLALSGQGEVELDNPVGDESLRNIDGFSGFDVTDGVQRVETEVDGVEQMRSVSDFEGDLPITVDVEYRLDGEVVDPSDLVGESGEVEVTFTVTNVTGQEQEISYPDGSGGTKTETVEVPLPLVGSLSTTLPASFTEVEAGGANMAGDGKGGTRLSYTMTLLAPIGSDTASFGYTAQMRDGVVPDASASVLPVDPMQNPTFKSAAASYESGAQTGAELTAGATEIDSNLLKIRDGASELLSGLIQLHDGSEELSAGLQGEAAPGSEQLAAGAKDLRDGLGQLDDGAGRLAGGAKDLRDGVGQLDDGAKELSSGAGRLSAGTGDALGGSKKLKNGLGRISGGLSELASAEGLPKAANGVDELLAGVDALIAGFGAPGQTGTLLDGLARLEDGAGQLEAGALQLQGGIGQLEAGLPAAKGGVDQINAQLSAGGDLSALASGLKAALGAACDAVCQGTIDAAIAQAENEIATQLDAASDGLTDVSDGLQVAIDGVALLVPGANQIVAGLGTLEAGAGEASAGAVKLKDGVNQVDGGLAQLEAGLASAVAGVLQLGDGASDAVDGAGDLAAGLGQLDDGATDLADGAGRLAGGTGDAADGAGQLASGANDLADGTGTARDGAGQLADGAGDLAAGLRDAADGSGQLEEGLGQAEDSAPALPEGAERLSDEGMSQLIAAGKGTAAEYGKLYATVTAGSERAQAGTMAFGAPEGAAGLMAYSFEIQGEDGEGGRNVARGVGAALLGGLGLGAFALRRRFFV